MTQNAALSVPQVCECAFERERESERERERERERARMRMLTVESFRRDAFMCVTCPEPYFMCRHQFVCFEEEKPLDSFLKPDSIFS